MEYPRQMSFGNQLNLAVMVGGFLFMIAGGVWQWSSSQTSLAASQRALDERSEERTKSLAKDIVTATNTLQQTVAALDHSTTESLRNLDGRVGVLERSHTLEATDTAARRITYAETITMVRDQLKTMETQLNTLTAAVDRLTAKSQRGELNTSSNLADSTPPAMLKAIP